MRLEVFAILLVLPVAAGSAAAQPVSVELDLAEARHCGGSVLPFCVVGHDPGPSPGPGDDDLHIFTVVERVAVEAEPVAGLPGRRVSVDYDETYVEHPVFTMMEGAMYRANGALPSQVAPYLRLGNGTTNLGDEGMWVTVRPWRLVPVHDANDTVTVPLVFYYPHALERERFYPLDEGGTGRGLELDWLLDGAAVLSATCRPEEEQFAGPGCAARRALGPEATRLLKETLPNVGFNSGVQRAEVGLGALPAVSSGGQDAAGSGGPAGSLLGAPPSMPPAEARSPMLPRSIEAAPQPAVSVPSSPEQRPALEPAASSVQAAPGAAFGSGVVAACAVLLLAVALYRRLRPEGLLDHPARRAILARIEQEPGTTTALVAAAFGLDYKTALHHLDMLVEGGLVSVQLVGRQRRFFVSSGPLSQVQRERMLVARRPGPRRVLALLGALGPVPRREVSRCTGLSRSGAWESVRDLECTGLVVVEGVGRHAQVRLTDRVRGADEGPGASGGPSPGPSMA